MDVIIKDLIPGQKYILQARSKAPNGATSPWSNTFKVTTVSDVTAPAPVTGLTWTVNGVSFKAAWTKPTLDSNGLPLKDFNGYSVTVTANATSKTFVTMQPNFDFSFDQNVAAFGTPQPIVDISVKVRDIVGNLSTAVTATATNAIPANVTGLTATGLPAAISLTWDATVENDFKTYEVYLSTASATFTPGSTNLITKTTSNSFVFPSTSLVTHYFKVRQVDMFNQPSAAYTSISATPINTSTLDTTAPNAPTAVTVTSTSDGNGGTARIDVSWTASSSSTLAGYVARFSTDQVSWQYINVPSNQTTAKISNLLPNTPYYVAVASISFVSSYSAFVNASTGGYPITTAKDTAAPSTPAIPTVSFGTSLIQISHNMLKADNVTVLENDVRYLEVHGSTTTGFTTSSSTLFGTIDVPAPGVAVSANFSYTPNDSTANMFWKVIAVDYSGNKSVASAQATGIPGLIQGANIANATITNAKINDLSAAKLTAGTAFVNNLSVQSALTLDAATGFIQSTNFNIANKTGWRLDQNGLVINDGSIAAKSLLLQNGNNIAPPPFADFEFNTDYYHDTANTPNANQLTATSGMLLATVFNGQKVGKQAMRIYNTSIANTVTHTLHFATGGQAATGVNIDVNPGDYILSVWAKKNGTVDQNIKLAIYTDTSAAVSSANILINSTTMSRYSTMLTVPSGVSKVKMYVDITPVTTGYDIVVDALQLEPKLTGDTTPSAWKPPSTTVIDGGSIITGSIRSSASAASVTGQPAWSINTQGNMQLGDALVRGRLTVGANNETKNLIPRTYTSFEDAAATYYDVNNVPNTATFDNSKGASANLRLQLQTTGSPPQGTNAMRIYATGLPANTQTELWFVPVPVNFNINTIVNQKYIISAWVKSNDTTKNPAVQFGFDSMTSTGGTKWAATPASWVPTATWTRISGVFTASTDNGFIYLNMWPAAAETVLDISIDGLQMEVAPAGVTAPSAWELGGIGGSAVQSYNYTSGSKGWVINSDGTVEFNTATIRGQLNVVGPLGEIDVVTDGVGQPTVYFYSPDKSKFGYINLPKIGNNYTLGVNGADSASTFAGTPLVRGRIWFYTDRIEIARVNSNQKPAGANINLSDNAGWLQWSDVNNVTTSLLTTQASGSTVMQSLNTAGTVVTAEIQTNQSGLVSIRGSDGVTALNGPGVWVSGSSVQFKSTVNEANAVQYSQTTKFLEKVGFDWTNLTFSNGWHTFAVQPQVRCDPTGRVFFRGDMVAGTTTNGVPIMSLPTMAWAPKVVENIHVAADSAANNIMKVDPNGTIYMYNPGAGNYFLGGANYGLI